MPPKCFPYASYASWNIRNLFYHLSIPNQTDVDYIVSIIVWQEDWRRQKAQILSLSAYDRHKQLVNDYMLFFPGATKLVLQVNDFIKYPWKELGIGPLIWCSIYSTGWPTKMFTRFCWHKIVILYDSQWGLVFNFLITEFIKSPSQSSQRYFFINFKGYTISLKNLRLKFCSATLPATGRTSTSSGRTTASSGTMTTATAPRTTRPTWHGRNMDHSSVFWMPYK